MGDAERSDSWPSVGRAVVERVGPRWLIVGAATGGVLWLESQQPGTLERWISAGALATGYVSATAVALAALVAALVAALALAVRVLWGSRERLRAECMSERQETAEVLRDMARATSDSSTALVERLGRIEARLDELARR